MAQTPRRWMRYLLVVSLGLNLLIVGLFVGAAFKKDHHKPRMSGMHAFIRALDKDDRRALRGALRDQKDLRQVAQVNRRAVMDALIMQPFNVDALIEAFDTQRDFANTLGAKSQAALIEIIEGMSSEERAAFAERVAMRMKKRRK